MREPGIVTINGNRLTQITDTPKFGEHGPWLSPDGRRIAFRGTHIAGFEDTEPVLQPGETANGNIYIMTLPRFDVTIDRPSINYTTIDLIWVTAVDQNYQILTSTNLIDWTEDGGHQR